MKLVMYGATDCDDTQRTRERLRQSGVTFDEVNLDHDAEAERFVLFINGGYRSTPTLVLDEGRRKVVWSEPTDDELDDICESMGR